MLTTRDIMRIMKGRKNFGGVYPINRLPIPLLRKPKGIIVNMDVSWGPGTHWVAIYVPKIGPAYYFDPFGGFPPAEAITLMERNSKYKWKYNTKKMQGDVSNLCGVYCIKFLKACPNYNEFLSKFKHCGRYNDKNLRTLK